MQTNLADFIRETPAGREADAILRKCVHCGFCTATCPTYQLLGNELDGPRGRIYLIKNALEGGEVTETTQAHLDRCLTCRACETTCPSGVRYGRLLDIGRSVIDARVGRKPGARLLRFVLRTVLARSRYLTPVIRTAQLLRALLPPVLRRRLPSPGPLGPIPSATHSRRVVMLGGCVQPALAPEIDAAAARVLDRLGVSTARPPGAGCCGALSYHLGAQSEGLDFMRANIDAWWPEIEAGAEAITATSSACAAMIKEYGELLAGDSRYAAKASRVSALARDASELVPAEQLAGLTNAAQCTKSVAFHTPCTLAHGQGLSGTVEKILTASGYQLSVVGEPLRCCGSAGTYSVLQPRLSRQLRHDKLAALGQDGPQLIGTANIGCLLHLRGGTTTPVVHWMQLVDDQLARS